MTANEECQAPSTQMEMFGVPRGDSSDRAHAAVSSPQQHVEKDPEEGARYLATGLPKLVVDC